MVLVALLVVEGAGVRASTRGGGVAVSGGEDGLQVVLVASQAKCGSSLGLDTAR